MSQRLRDFPVAPRTLEPNSGDIKAMWLQRIYILLLHIVHNAETHVSNIKDVRHERREEVRYGEGEAGRAGDL